jgi:Lrp/AsnC family transcriptional regulator for asnA, asnC and gidA
MCAFVLITTEIGAMEQVFQDLKMIDGVIETYLLYGVYDIITIVKADSMRQIKEVISWKIRRINHILTSQTLIAMDEL